MLGRTTLLYDSLAKCVGKSSGCAAFYQCCTLGQALGSKGLALGSVGPEPISFFPGGHSVPAPTHRNAKEKLVLLISLNCCQCGYTVVWSELALEPVTSLVTVWTGG